MTFGLIGKSLAHSFSPQYFAEKFKLLNLKGYSYLAFPLTQITDFPDLLMQHPNIVGLNVTIPYKEDIMPFLDDIDPEADRIGAVNTILVTKNRRLVGYNTDVIGFLKPIENNMSDFKQALVLGTGGASKSVVYALKTNHVNVDVVSRSSKKGFVYNNIKDLSSYDLIVNCTPLGMHPNENTYPELPYNTLHAKQTLYDLVYNPSETVFLRHGIKHDCRIINGFDMLKEQAEASWRIWMNEN